MVRPFVPAAGPWRLWGGRPAPSPRQPVLAGAGRQRPPRLGRYVFWSGWGVQAVRVVLLIVSMLLALPALAAQSPVGLWRMDEAGLERAVDQLITGLLARIPEEDRADAERLMTEQRAEMKSQMASSLAATIEFAADGTVIFNDPESPDTERGSWTQEGDTLHVVDSDPESPDLSGTVADGRIELNFDVDPNDPDQGPLGEMTWVLVPVR